LAPKISAINGTTARPNPLKPAFAIPSKSARRRNRTKNPGVRAGCNDAGNGFIEKYLKLNGGKNI
jgi:hypothetical protein